jgi:chemotaxis protein MotB
VKDQNIPPEPVRAAPADHRPFVPRALPAVHAGGRTDPSSLAQEIRTLLLKDLVEDAGHVRTEPNGVVIVLGERVLFDPGKAALIGPARPALDHLADLIVSGIRDRRRGHTDNTADPYGRFSFNWELSLARANSVVQALIARGVPPGALGKKGTSEHLPRDLQRCERGARASRRVEIRLMEPGRDASPPIPGQSPFVSL